MPTLVGEFDHQQVWASRHRAIERDVERERVALPVRHTFAFKGTLATLSLSLYITLCISLYLSVLLYDAMRTLVGGFDHQQV
jgi:hypothetical protein